MSNKNRNNFVADLQQLIKAMLPVVDSCSDILYFIKIKK